MSCSTGSFHFVQPSIIQQAYVHHLQRSHFTKPMQNIQKMVKNTSQNPSFGYCIISKMAHSYTAIVRLLKTGQLLLTL